MDGSWWWCGVWVLLPAEEGAEAEMLDDGEFGEDFGVVHFKHALGYISERLRGFMGLSDTLLILPHPACTPEIS